MMNIYLSHSSSHNYETDLYEPMKSSGVLMRHKILFPHDKENIDNNSKELIQHTDLMVADVTYPSTGQGIELGWANDAGIRIVCIHKVGAKPSRSLRFITQETITYTDPADMVHKLEKLVNLRH